MSEQHKNSSSNLLSSLTTAEITRQTLPQPDKIIVEDYGTPPLTMGPQRLHYFYSAVLPQVHLTLISILQGIAFGVLLLGIPLPSDTSRLPSFEFCLQVYFYLPYLISSLGILIIWKQFVYASAYADWPVSTPQIGLIYLIAVGEIVAYRVISVPPTKLSGTLSVWLICVGFVLIVGGCIRLNNLRLQGRENFRSLTLAKFSNRTQLFNGILYLSAGLAIITFGLWYNQVVNMLKNWPQIASLIPWAVYVSLLIMLCLFLLLDSRSRHPLLRELIKGSGLVLSSQGVMSYKKEGVMLVDQYGKPMSPKADFFMQHRTDRPTV